MKQILILVDKMGKKKELLAKLVARRLDTDTRLSLSRFSDLTFSLSQGRIEVETDGQNIKEFDLVYVRRAGLEFFTAAGTLAAALSFHKIKFFDSAFGKIGAAGSKLTSLVRLAGENLPIIPSFFCWHTAIERHWPTIASLGLPVVAKELSSQRGKGVYLVSQREELAKLPPKDSRGENNEYLFQKFIVKEDEYRLLVLGDRVRVAERKKASAKDEFRNNISLGGEEEFLALGQIPETIQATAVKAAKILGVEIAGVDVVTEKGTGRHWLLEVNRGPGLTYDTSLSPEIDELAKFLQEEVKK